MNVSSTPLTRRGERPLRTTGRPGIRRLGWLLALTVTAVGAAAERTVAEWDFRDPAQAAQWRANAHLAEVRLVDGSIECRAVNHDPILELVAPIEFAASPWQFLEVRLRASRDGTAEWFWSNTTEGRHGGFTQPKATRFAVRGDGSWRTWRVFPFWQAEGRIVRLRFDLYDGAEFAVAGFRVGELEMPATAVVPDFTFTNTTCGWRAAGGVELAVVPDGLAIAIEAADGFLLGPPVRLTAEAESHVSIELAVDRGRHATLLFATDQRPGLQRWTFPVEATGELTSHHLDLLAAPEWRGQIIALGLQPGDEPGTRARLGRLHAGGAPTGPPRLEVSSFAPVESVLRAGRPTRLNARIANLGATALTRVQAALTVPEGLRLLSGPGTDRLPARLDFDEALELEWSVESIGPGGATVRLMVGADNAAPREIALDLRFAPGLDLPPAAHVPEPQPVRGPIEVGAYYFPGWRSAGQWQPLLAFPERRPALGWYREGDPEVADWHIKWAVEHGITFFVYDWYWSAGARQLEHALHDGYFNARHRHLLKFCLLWANHNPPGTHSHADCLEVTRYWIEHYFHRPEHLRIDGRPVMILFSPGRLTEDLGSAGVRGAFEAMREECRRAGLGGLYLLACVADAGEARVAAEEGYDAITAYNWAGLGRSGSSLFAPFATLIEGYHQQWKQLRETSALPLLLPVSGGWDSRPWHGQNNLVRYGRTPELFRDHLVEARRFLEAQPARSAVERFVLVEAWNEWGEGSYIEPHQEFGFGYLDAIRDVFTGAPREHLDLVPADVGLGPYDVAMDSPGRTAWTFDQDDDGWGHGMYLEAMSVVDGVLTARTTGNDPAFFGPPIQAAAAGFRFVELRLRLSPADGRPFTDLLQLFWRTTRLPESEATSVRLPVRVDGQWHDYRLAVGDNVRWRGIVTRLRLDPCSRPGVEVSVDRIRLVR